MNGGYWPAIFLLTLFLMGILKSGQKYIKISLDFQARSHCTLSTIQHSQETILRHIRVRWGPQSHILLSVKDCVRTVLTILVNFWCTPDVSNTAWAFLKEFPSTIPPNAISCEWLGTEILSKWVFQTITLAEKQLKPRNNIHMRLCKMWPLMLLAEDVYSAVNFII